VVFPIYSTFFVNIAVLTERLYSPFVTLGIPGKLEVQAIRRSRDDDFLSECFSMVGLGVSGPFQRLGRLGVGC